jgi:alkylresorcinol/alkylpyrone synthase
MSAIIGVGTSVPPHAITQDQAGRFAARMFDRSELDIDRLLPIFENTTIRRRHFCGEIGWFETQAGYAAKHRLFVENGLALAREAILKACHRTDTAPHDIDHIFFITSTGIATPSLDAHLFNALHLKPALLRTPIWGLGCGGGVAGMARAHDWLSAYPRKTALVVALELCSLTFIRNDMSKSNFVATALFGDGCGALLMVGDEHPQAAAVRPALRIEASGSITWPDSLTVMGWDVTDEGLKVVFSKNIPRIVHQLARPALAAFIADNGLLPADIRHFLSHPGGAKVIEAYCAALDLQPDQVRSMRAVMADYGNMSSATVFFVLEHFLDSETYRCRDWALATALGPGFFSEMILARCL